MAVSKGNFKGLAPGSLNRVGYQLGWGKGGNVTAGWQVTMCDPIWYVSSRGDRRLRLQTAIRLFTFTSDLASFSVRLTL